MNMKVYRGLTAGERALVDYMTGASGHFRTALFKAMSFADLSNLNLMAKGFPEEVAAWKKYTTLSGWWEELYSNLFPERRRKSGGNGDS